MSLWNEFAVNEYPKIMAMKPVFLTRGEREKLAIQRFREAELGQQIHGGTANPARRRREKETVMEIDRHRNRKREREEEHKASDRSISDKLELEIDLEALKDQYLGSKKPKKRVIIKPSEKFRVSNFDWDNSDHTPLDTNVLCPEPCLLYGRGFRAGIDRIEQKKESIHRIDRHWSEKNLDEMTERDWRIFSEDFSISYKGGGSKIPKPIRNWGESHLIPELMKAVVKAGYNAPSPIQMAAIPLGLQQQDMIGIAGTGSGKTAAFILPMLDYISKLPNTNEENECDGPYAVVMAPTRELAQQIENETVKFARYLGIKVVSIVGGRSIEEQGFKIGQGCEIVIATPGRLIDCLERRYIVLNRCNYVVLDEADRMIDMGFETQVIGVLNAMQMQSDRTTYMFSATMPPAVERLARKYLKNPVVVSIGKSGESTRDLITQRVIMMKESDKMLKLKKILYELDNKTAIVFVNTKRVADYVAKTLDREGYRVTVLHGRKSQEQREISLEGFRTKKYDVLVATDVVGRGIDVPDVGHVINYDMPGKIETYTHRIGRTGRAGKTGVATTFLTLGDKDVFYDLKQMLIESKSHVPIELARHEAAKCKPGAIRDMLYAN